MDSSNPNLGSEEEINKLRAERVSLKRAAPLIGMSYPTLLRLVHDKKIKAIKIGNGWKVTKYEIRRFLEFGNHPDSEQKD
jgi:excisionase family DNA binding protein